MAALETTTTTAEGRLDLDLRLRTASCEVVDLVASDGVDEYSPALSNDGTQVAYVERTGKGTEIMRAPAEANGAKASTVLVASNGLMGDPAWSPDGGQLVYWLSENDAPPQLWILDLATGASKLAYAGEKFAVQPAWSPDGKRLAFTLGGTGEGSHVAIVDLATGTVTAESDALMKQPAWSSDGAQVLAVQSPGDPGDEEGADYGVAVLDGQTAETVRSASVGGLTALSVMPTQGGLEVVLALDELDSVRVLSLDDDLKALSSHDEHDGVPYPAEG